MSYGRDDFNELSATQAEVLALLAEEAAEVVQAVTKILRHGLRSKHPDNLRGPDNLAMLATELGDLRAATWLVTSFIDRDLEGKIMKATKEKYAKVGKYLHHAWTAEQGDE